MFDPIKIKNIGDLLAESKKIALICHKNPDGDTIGAALAMYHYLSLKGYDVNALVPNDFPDFYRWLPGSEKMHIYNREAKYVRQCIAEADVVFCLDFNSLDRSGNMADALVKTMAVKIMIDHHQAPSDEFDYCFSVVDTSSTGELVFEFIEALGDREMIDLNTAMSLYTCIMTDTGSFSFSCNHARTYEIVADLIRIGVDADKVHKLVYDTYSENRLRLLGFAISSRMLVWDELHTAVIYLSREDLKQFDFQIGDTEGVVNYPLSIAHINLAVLMTEKDDIIRISFRSKGDFDVNVFARKHFNGGGHCNASGGNSKKSLTATLDGLKETLVQYKSALNYQITLE